jgi:putative transcriptional regulator
VNKSTISNQVRRLRFEAGEMTQQALADAVGVTRQTIIAIESAKYSPSLEVAFGIARVFGVPLEAVFQFEPARSRAAPKR